MGRWFELASAQGPTILHARFKQSVGKQLKVNRSFSRRRFLTVGSLSMAGLWTACSEQLPARALRGLVAETGRAVLKPKFTPTPGTWSSNEITAAWLGHSTVLLNFYGVTVLTDPVLFNRIGADTGLGTLGPKRFVASALRARQLPTIDLVLLSHAHMDHLEPASLRALPGHPQVVTAHDTSDLLRSTRLRNPQTLKWGQRTRVVTENGDLEIQAFEVKHWGARWKYDKYRGYNGYVLAREGRKIIFGGDTAWSGSFRKLRNQGPYELAIMPIGAYQPWVCSHCTPEQALCMTNDAGAHHLLPVHFKTFPLGREGTVEPMERLEAAIESERLGWRDIGQTFQLSA